MPPLLRLCDPAGDVRLAEDALGSKAVVRFTPKAPIEDRRGSAQGMRQNMIDLEPMAGRATLAAWA
jgi:hypothetical protein